MKLLVFLAIVLAAAGTVNALCPRSLFQNIRASAQDCHNSTSLEICESKGNCTWCSSTLVPSGCYHISEAALLPGFAFQCIDKPSLEAPVEQTQLSNAATTMNPAPGPQPGAGCTDAKEKKPCKKLKGCVWCDMKFGPGQGSCYEEDQAKWLPPQVFKCGKPKKPTTEEVAAIDSLVEAAIKALNPGPGPGPQPGAGCTDAKEKKPCKKLKGCVWCDMKFGPGQGSCYEEDQAKWLPPQVFKCGKPKKPTAKEVAATDSVVSAASNNDANVART